MNLKLRFKIWLENDEGKAVIGLGKVKILKAIRRTGSIAAAARELKQPYRNVWAKLREAEKQCGFKLVTTEATGSKLTHEGEQLLQSYMRLFSSCSRSALSKFHQIFDENCPKCANRKIDQDWDV